MNDLRDKSIMYKLLKNSDDKNTFLHDLFSEREYSTIEDQLKIDQDYQIADKKAESAIQKLQSHKWHKDEWKLIDDTLTKYNSQSREYSRIAYSQGFKDALMLFIECYLPARNNSLERNENA